MAHYDLGPLEGLAPAQLDAAYSNSGAVGNFPEIMARFQARSAAFYGARQVRRGLPYGSQPRQVFDWIGADTHGKAPLFVFIHGGYWQYCVKEDFAFIAEGPLALGMHVALVEYRLAPVARMSDIAADIAAFLEHLHAHLDEWGVDRARVCLSGHSAGGHLTAVHRSHVAVSHAMPISALVDLEPIRRTNLNAALQLSAGEIAELSPLRHLETGAFKPTTLTVGGDELPELQRHSRCYVQAAQSLGQPVDLLTLDGLHHFSVLDDLAQADGRQMRALQRLFGR